MALLQIHGDLVTQSLFKERASGRQLAVFAFPVLLLLAEAGVTTFIVCRRLYPKRSSTSLIPTSIKSILLINVFLTVILICATLGEGIIMSCKVIIEHRRSTWMLDAQRRATGPLSSTASSSGILWQSEMPVNGGLLKEKVKPEEDTGAAAAAHVGEDVDDKAMQMSINGGLLKEKIRSEEDGDDKALQLIVEWVMLGLVWMVVVVYVGAVWVAALRVEAGDKMQMSAGGPSTRWSLQALRKIMYVVDRSKWVGLCFALVFSTRAYFGVDNVMRLERYVNWQYLQKFDDIMNDGQQARLYRARQLLMGFVQEGMRSERAWRWTAASSTLILQALVSLYTLAARLTLHSSCKRFSLQLAADHDLMTGPLISDV